MTVETIAPDDWETVTPAITDPPRVCRTCGHERPGRMFRSTGVLPSGRVKRHGPCDLCRERTTPKRIPKVNQAGNVWCSNCRQYVAPDAIRWLDPPSFTKPRWSSYCIACQRELDRLRWTGERRERLNQRRVVNQRKQASREQRERREFVRNAIAILRKRGLTKAEIVRLAGVSWTLVLDAERGTSVPDPNTAQRFLILLQETAHLPMAREPAARRRLPMPGLDDLIARIEPRVAQFPMRSRWRDAA